MTIELAKTVACKLIGIHGHAGAGKDTVADYIREKYDNTWKLAFAGPLKSSAASLFGLPVEAFNERAVKEQADPWWGISPRQMAQFFGTEMVRETMGRLLPDVGADFWIYRMEGILNGVLDSEEYTADDVVIIPDVRFQNEADWIWKNGGIVIHLTRAGADGIVGIPSHPSEGSIEFHNWDAAYLLYNNGTLEALYNEVENILTATRMYPFSDPDSF